jgi:hypothetical protein
VSQMRADVRSEVVITEIDETWSIVFVPQLISGTSELLMPALNRATGLPVAFFVMRFAAPGVYDAGAIHSR